MNNYINKCQDSSSIIQKTKIRNSHKSMNKLMTKEDPYHLHKLCGVYCIANYIFQTFQFIVYRNDNYLNAYTLLPHILLHASSFIFRVLPTRPVEKKSSMFIWNELRIHAMLFAYRACFVLLFPTFAFQISLATMALADLTSQRYGTAGVTTVRGRNEKVGSRSLAKELSAAFFSISQFGATVITTGAFQSAPHNMLVFLTLPPIQTSAFGMTLMRKNLITKSVWTVVYSFELAVLYLVWFREYRDMNVLFISTLLYFFRRIGISKYLLWTCVFLLHQYFQKQQQRYLPFISTPIYR